MDRESENIKVENGRNDPFILQYVYSNNNSHQPLPVLLGKVGR